MSPENCVGTGGSLGGGDSAAPAREVVKPLLLQSWERGTSWPFHTANPRRSRSSTLWWGIRLISGSIPILSTSRKLSRSSLLFLLNLATVSAQVDEGVCFWTEIARRLLMAALWDQLPWPCGTRSRGCDTHGAAGPCATTGDGARAEGVQTALGRLFSIF